MSVVSDYPDYAPHVAHANQIAATGVPLLTKSNRLYQQAFPAVGPGNAAGTGTLSVSQIGYEVLLSAQFPLGTASPFCEAQITWKDSTTGFIVDTDSFILTGSTAVGGWSTNGKGPTKGDQMTVKVTNLDAASSAAITITVLQNSRVYPRDKWFGVNNINSGMTVPGFTLPRIPDDETVLGMLGGVSIPATSTSEFLFGMHSGAIAVGLDQGAGPWTSIGLMIAAVPSSAYTADNPIYAAVAPPPAFQIAGSRSPLRVELHNTATTSFTATMSMIALD